MSDVGQKKNTFFSQFMEKLNKAIGALSREEKEIKAFSERGVDLSKLKASELKNVPHEIKEKVEKTVSSEKTKDTTDQVKVEINVKSNDKKVSADTQKDTEKNKKS